jgi:hypothetical protein
VPVDQVRDGVLGRGETLPAELRPTAGSRRPRRRARAGRKHCPRSRRRDARGQMEHLIHVAHGNARPRTPVPPVTSTGTVSPSWATTDIQPTSTGDERFPGGAAYSACARSGLADIRRLADVAAGEPGRRWPGGDRYSLDAIEAPVGSSRSFPNRDRLGGGCPPGRYGRTLTPVLPVVVGNHHAEGSLRVNKIHISKRHRPAIWRLEPLSADPRDRDIMRAKQFAGRSRPPGAAPRARNAKPDRGIECAEDRHA